MNLLSCDFVGNFILEHYFNRSWKHNINVYLNILARNLSFVTWDSCFPLLQQQGDHATK